MSTVWKKIVAYNKDRLPEMVLRKFQAMRANVFGFYRGTCHLYAEDYKARFKYKDRTRIWICGDLHFENFGTYRDMKGKVYFDMNDFDEAALGPVSFEVTRLITSFYVAASQFKIPEKNVAVLANDIFDSYMAILQKSKPLNGYKAIRSPMIKQMIRTVKKRKELELLNSGVKFGMVPTLRIIKGHTIQVAEELILIEKKG